MNFIKFVFVIIVFTTRASYKTWWTIKWHLLLDFGQMSLLEALLQQIYYNDHESLSSIKNISVVFDNFMYSIMLQKGTTATTHKCKKKNTKLNHQLTLIIKGLNDNCFIPEPISHILDYKSLAPPFLKICIILNLSPTSNDIY
jgi:hypothetical protein